MMWIEPVGGCVVTDTEQLRLSVVERPKVHVECQRFRAIGKLYQRVAQGGGAMFASLNRVDEVFDPKDARFIGGGLELASACGPSERSCLLPPRKPRARSPSLASRVPARSSGVEEVPVVTFEAMKRVERVPHAGRKLGQSDEPEVPGADRREQEHPDVGRRSWSDLTR